MSYPSLTDRRFIYLDSMVAVRHYLTHEGYGVTAWDYIGMDSYAGLPLTQAGHAGIVAYLYGIDLTPCE